MNDSVTFNGSNNTNKLSPQEHTNKNWRTAISSNNTNKLSPQERSIKLFNCCVVQIIQINLVLKNCLKAVLVLKRFK